MTKARDIASAIPAPSTVDATELGYLDGVTSAIQTQLDAKTAKATLTTTGDIYYASAANTPARLAIGSTSNVLTVAGGIPSWAAAAAPSWVGAIIKKSTSQDIDNNTLTAITWDEEDFDTNTFHSTASNTSRLTVPSGYAGKYLLNLHGNVEQDGTGRRAVRLYKNGESFQRGVTFLPTTSDGIGIQYFDYSTVCNLAVADYLEVYFFQNSGSTKRFYGGANSALSFTYLGA